MLLCYATCSLYLVLVSVASLPQLREAVEDRLHFFSEECDSLQGFHLLVDWAGGFGGVAGGMAQDIRDEFPAKGLLFVLLSPLSQALDQVC